MSQRKSLLALLLVVGLVFAVGGCRKKEIEDTAPPPPPPPVEEPVAPPPPKQVKEETVKPPPMKIEPSAEERIRQWNKDGVLKTVYFDFDKYDLSTTTRATLRMNADWLRANPGYNIVIEGHCDERGSIEYNLALGEKRANATRDFLRTLGVESTGLRIVSYGEERPAMNGRNESAWSKNRRAEFLIESKR